MMALAEDARKHALLALKFQLSNHCTDNEEEARRALDKLADDELHELATDASALCRLCEEMLYERVYGRALTEAS